MHDEYRPSSAPLLESTAASPRSSLVAILLGGLVVDVIGSMLLGGTLATVAAILVAGSGEGRVNLEALTASTVFLALVVGSGSVMSIAGGYTAGWWARRRPMAHALGAGSLSLVLSTPGYFLEREATPLWLDVVSLAIHLPLAVTGGYLSARFQRRK